MTHVELKVTKKGGEILSTRPGVIGQENKEHTTLGGECESPENRASRQSGSDVPYTE